MSKKSKIKLDKIKTRSKDAIIQTQRTYNIQEKCAIYLISQFPRNLHLPAIIAQSLFFNLSKKC